MYTILWYSIIISLMKVAPFNLLFFYHCIDCIIMILIHLLFGLSFWAKRISRIAYGLHYSCLFFLFSEFYCYHRVHSLLTDLLCYIYLYLYLSEYQNLWWYISGDKWILIGFLNIFRILCRLVQEVICSDLNEGQMEMLVFVLYIF